MLHQKELVLNADDTQNILNAVEIMRNITNSIGSTIFDKLAKLSANSSQFNDNFGDTLEQNVHIEAQFPNVTNSHEIEDALNNLVNMASMRASNRRR